MKSHWKFSKNYLLYRPLISCNAFCMSGAFFGLIKVLVLTGWVDDEDPTPTADAALKTVQFARAATRADGLATAFLAVPCIAWKPHNHYLQYYTDINRYLTRAWKRIDLLPSYIPRRFDYAIYVSHLGLTDR